MGALLPLGLLLWAVGVQLNEAVALTGALLCFGGALRLLAVGGAAPPRGLALLPFAFVLWGVLGPLLGGRAPEGVGVARLLDWALLPTAALAWGAATQRQRRAVVVAAGATLLASCAAAALQHLGAWPPEEAFSGLTWTRIPFGRVYETVPGREDRFMAGGLTFHRLRFAHVTGLLATCAAVAAFSAQGRARWALAALGALGLVSVAVFPHARAALGAGGLALLVGVAAAARSAKATSLTAAALAATLGLVLLLAPSVRARLGASLTAEGSGERLHLVRAGLNAVAAHPWTGVGAGRFRPGDWAEPDAPPEVRAHPGRAHNQLVTLAAELGVPGALLWLALLAALAWRGARAGREGAVLLAALTFVLALSALHDVLFHAEVSLAAVLVLGCASAVATPPSAPRTPPR